VTAGAQRLVRARVDLGKPAVELMLEVDLVGEDPAGLEVGLGVALQPLNGALGLRISGSAEMPIDLQLAAERSELVAGAAVVGVDAGLAIPDQRVRQPAQLPKAAPDPGQQIGLLLAEDQRAGAGSRVAQAGDHDPALAGLAVADGDLLAWLPDVELADLAGTVDGARVVPCGLKQRPDLAQEVIKDGLATDPAQRPQQLADPNAGQVGVLGQQSADLVLKRVELRAPGRPRIARWRVAGDRPPDRLAMQPRLPTDLADRQPAHKAQPSDLCPLLHPDHPGPPRLALRTQAQERPRLWTRCCGPRAPAARCGRSGDA
jgi:hypothetical protein